MKQSSIEWLFEQYKLIGMLTIAQVQKAKAMHKVEIMNAHGEEQSYLEDDGSWTRQTAEQYYNETFNTNKENLPDSTNGYTYYPLEHKTIFNTEEK